jgi:hypothetical protein
MRSGVLVALTERVRRNQNRLPWVQPHYKLQSKWTLM